jgi:hypothetical protein
VSDDRYSRSDADYVRDRKVVAAPAMRKEKRALAALEAELSVPCTDCGRSGVRDGFTCGTCGGTGYVLSRAPTAEELRRRVEEIAKDRERWNGVPAPHERELMFVKPTPTKHGGKYWGVRIREVLTAGAYPRFVVVTRWGALHASPQEKDRGVYRSRAEAEYEAGILSGKKTNEGYKLINSAAI